MRLLVISDSHKNTRVIEKILEREAEARHIFFLGDNVSDIEDFDFLYPNKKFYAVSGNCDYDSLVPAVGIEKIEDINILYTHGHTFGVKYGNERLLSMAKETNCKIALYGHTHVSHISYEDGIYIVNPGSCSRPRDFSKPSYAVIDIEKKGILPSIVSI